MSIPATPNPLHVQAAIKARKDKENEAARQSEASIAKIRTRVEEAKKRDLNRYETRKKAQALKKSGKSVQQIAEELDIPESSVRTILKPYEPKPHLTQRIEGLEEAKAQLEKGSEK